MKDNNNGMFVFMHGDEEEQREFIKKCSENGCFAQEIKFMVRQKPKSLYLRSMDNKPLDEKVFIHGERPYFTISNADPDQAGNYFSWTYLESVIESGWKHQFSRS